MYPLGQPRNPDREREKRVAVIEMAMMLANEYHLGHTGDVEVADDRYGRYVETFPPGMATQRHHGEHEGDPDIEVPLPEPVVIFLDCREDVATHVVYLAEVGSAERSGA